MCSSRNNPYPPHGRSLEIPRGRGVLKAKFLEAMHENKLEFPGGRGGCKTKNLSWGEHGYFLDLHNKRFRNFTEFLTILVKQYIFKTKHSRLQIDA